MLAGTRDCLRARQDVAGARCESRNGTFVNDQKVDEAVLGDGHTIRVGSCEFSFHQTAQPPTAGSVVSDLGKETIVRDMVMGDFVSSDYAISAIQDSDQAHDLLLLYQLSIKLLGCGTLRRWFASRSTCCARGAARRWWDSCGSATRGR